MTPERIAEIERSYESGFDLRISQDELTELCALAQRALETAAGQATTITANQRRGSDSDRQVTASIPAPSAAPSGMPGELYTIPIGYRIEIFPPKGWKFGTNGETYYIEKIAPAAIDAARKEEYAKPS